MAGKRLAAKIGIYYHPRALEELQDLEAEVQADVIQRIVRLDGRTQVELVSMLDRRTERKMFQWESGARAGTLRIVFAWGKGCMWMIGAFVKANDKEGERFMKRIRPRAVEVEDWEAE